MELLNRPYIHVCLHAILHPLSKLFFFSCCIYQLSDEKFNSIHDFNCDTNASVIKAIAMALLFFILPFLPIHKSALAQLRLMSERTSATTNNYNSNNNKMLKNGLICGYVEVDDSAICIQRALKRFFHNLNKVRAAISSTTLLSLCCDTTPYIYI